MDFRILISQIIVISFLCAIIMIIIQETSSAHLDYQEAALQFHNEHRSHHHVDPLALSDDLNSRALKCAEYYAKHDILDHSCPENGQFGENLWSNSKTKTPQNRSAQIATDAWYAEEYKHNWTGDWQPISSHFSQIVWKNTSQLGFGLASSAKRIYGCALYYPHGNVKMTFQKNVLEHDHTTD